MDTYITPEELKELGVELDDTELEKIVDELNDMIDELVGEEIVESLTPEDVDKLADLQDNASEEELANWIVEHVPDYPEIMENNKTIVLGDYAETLEEE